jgi:hypothetical protein
LKAIRKAIDRLERCSLLASDDPPAKTAADVLLFRTRAYATATESWPESEKQFIPHPATWFNRGSYDDDPATWERKGSGKEGYSYART